MRLLDVPPWPSATKMSPLGAIATAEGIVEHVGSSACGAGLAERHENFPFRREFKNLVAFAVFTLAVGDPHVAFFVRP